MRLSDGVSVALSVCLHIGILVAFVPTSDSDPSPSRRASRTPLQIVTLDRAMLREILDPAPPVPGIVGLREARSPSLPAEAPAWPRAEVTPPALSEVESAVIGVPRIEPGLPLEGPAERLHVFRPLIVRPAVPAPRRADAGVGATVGEGAGTGSRPVAGDGKSEPTQALPNLDDARRLLSRRVVPEYPERARRLGLEGVTSVGLEIGDDGRVLETWLLRSSGSRILDRRALQVLREWRFDMNAVRESGFGLRFRQDVGFALR